MSSGSGHAENVLDLDFASVTAQYIEFYAADGDNKYKIGEVQIFRDPAADPVPELTTLLLLGSGIAGILAFRRKNISR